ncbi:hypothetical protein [Priestia koreensis]|uniref:hypothetical protein n=1 Tax=Priestia koreensis TaxID=284581 RepID=UPI001F5AB913|nr:hypothetical protein [Priestia koreensis]UNL86381.1 hypothetical protein IE339_07790 [Priestia koreensis]
MPSHRNETPPANNRRSVDPPKPRTVVEKVSKAQLESLKNKKGAQYKVDGNRKIERVESTKGTIKDGVSNRAIDRYYEKTQNIRSDINREVEKIINSDEYKNLSNTQKKKIDRKVKK